MRRKILDFHPWETAGWPKPGGENSCANCHATENIDELSWFCTNCTRTLTKAEKEKIIRAERKRWKKLDENLKNYPPPLRRRRCEWKGCCN